MSNLSIESEVSLSLDGKVIENPRRIADYGSSQIYRIKVEVPRTSGIIDEFFVNYSSDLNVNLKEGLYISIKGDIRSLNKKNSDFVIESYVNATEITILDEEPETYTNDVYIKFAELYEFVEFRNSYNDDSKKVAVIKLKLQRKHGRYSYFKVSSWNANAIYLNSVYKDTEFLDVKCRLQSYISKKSGNLYMHLVAYYVTKSEV